MIYAGGENEDDDFKFSGSEWLWFWRGAVVVGVGGFGFCGSGVSGLTLFCSFSMALRRILKTACVRDSENRSLTTISVISFTYEVDKILLGVLDVVVRILGFELSLESSKRILQIVHQQRAICELRGKDERKQNLLFR